jgi:hypothetical protein
MYWIKAAIVGSVGMAATCVAMMTVEEFHGWVLELGFAGLTALAIYKRFEQICAEKKENSHSDSDDPRANTRNRKKGSSA